MAEKMSAASDILWLMAQQRHKAAITCMAFGLLLALPQFTVAAPQYRSNMSYRSVLTLAGPAAEKREMESRREQLWFYPDGTCLKFREGRLVSAPGLESLTEKAPPVKSSPFVNQPVRPKPLKPVKSDRSGRVAGLLRDIMKTIPSSDSPGSLAPDPTVKQPQMRTPMRPPARVIDHDDFEDMDE